MLRLVGCRLERGPKVLVEELVAVTGKGVFNARLVILLMLGISDNRGPVRCCLILIDPQLLMPMRIATLWLTAATAMTALAVPLCAPLHAMPSRGHPRDQCSL